MRMNISVPDELAEQVRTLNIPISHVCQKALSAEVQVAQRQAAFVGDFNVVAARLRSTRSEESIMKFEEGFDHGFAWAKDCATFAELKYLAEEELLDQYDDTHTIVAFVSGLTGQHVTSVNTRDGDRSYWEGFINGAHDVWTSVEPLI
jgi:hypothetical protein